MKKSIVKSLFLCFIFVVTGIVSCKDDFDPCEGVYCLYDGYCSNGTCVCPEEHMTGNCTFVKTPVSVTIKKIVLKEYPVVRSNGNSWDSTNGADPFISIYRTNSSSDQFNTHVEEYNATGQEIEFELNIPYTITEPTAEWTFFVRDHDGAGDYDSMAGVYFKPADKVNVSLPESFEVRTSSIKLEIYADWYF